MPATIAVPLLGDLAPEGFVYTGQYLVEFDADSLWYETSLTIAALALGRGMKTEYHVFQHFPNEALDALSRLGIDAKKLEQDGLLSVWDSYTPTTEFEASKLTGIGWESSRGKPLDIVKGAAKWVERTKAGFPEEEKGWLHLDDNTAIFLQYNDEKTVIDSWRTALVPAVRARECPHFLAFPKGVASDAFYTKFEALCDGIIDLKSEEKGDRIERFLRIRTLRGKTFDSRWHRLQVRGNGEVAIASAVQTPEVRRLAAIMFTDTVGYTAAAQADEGRTLDLLRQQTELIRPVLAAHEGREIKSTGDGLLVEFDSALKATQCAIDIQRRIYERNAEGGIDPFQVRIGIHLGDVVRRGTDILGDAVNIAARIEPVAEPGGICVSGAVREQVWNKIPDKLEKLPPKALKGVQVSTEIYRILLPWTVTSAPSVNSGPTRLAVLPFVNISPDPTDAYFADGLTEELITVLSQLRELRVIARTSVSQFKSTTKSLAQISAELGVDAVLEGSVRKVGDRLRITVQLIDAGTQEHTWARTYDRTVDNVFAVQTEIAKRVAKRLKLNVRGVEEARLEARPPVRPDSYLAFLKGRTILQSMSQASLEEARVQFELAISLDLKNAAAHSALADVTRMVGWWYGGGSREKWDETARRLTARALELDPNLAEAHASFAIILQDDYEYVAAEKEFKLALSLNPSYAQAHNWYGALLEDEARTEEALREYTLAEGADPLSPGTLSALATLLLFLGRLDEALVRIQRLGELQPSRPTYILALSRYYLARSDTERSVKELERFEEVQSEPLWKPVARAYYYAFSGRKEEARLLLRHQETLPEFPPSAWIIAWVYAELGELDDCFRWLDKAVQFHNLPLPYFRLDPRLEHVRRDPRFHRLLKRINLA